MTACMVSNPMWKVGAKINNTQTICKEFTKFEDSWGESGERSTERLVP